jgi:hypothetical protein
MPNTWTVGVISDTHGLVRPEALAALAGADHIVHAGDIGALEVLAALAAIAPVTAVRGNNDHGPWALRLPAATTVRVGDVRLHVLHDVHELAIDPHTVDVVISGHSHRPVNERRDGVLYFNPGSAGPRRFTLPIAVGRLRIADATVAADVHSIDAPSAPSRR